LRPPRFGHCAGSAGFPDDGSEADPISPEEQRQSEEEAIKYAQLFWSASRIDPVDHAYLTEWLTKRSIRLPIPDHCVRVVAATRPYFYGRIAKCQRLDGTVVACHLRDYRTKNKGFIHGMMSGQHAAVQLAAPINNDHDKAGLKAMETATRRYTQQGFDVRQWVPPTVGHDWNDVLILQELANAKT